MTERFVTAAELMARVLGMPGYPFHRHSAPDQQRQQRGAARHGRNRRWPPAINAAARLLLRLMRRDCRPRRTKDSVIAAGRSSPTLRQPGNDAFEAG